MNPEHLEHVQAPDWNEWRAERPSLTPDFTDARLHAVDLSGKNLSGADFSRAKVEGCNLSGASLARAHVTGASFN
ncbi:MAG: pentapeptide repeat-containing protein, partial [Thermoanaerobaculia bacterium]